MSQNKPSVLPPGLKTRTGLVADANQRLPSMASIISKIGGANKQNVALTRGGAAKRTFKPKIPTERVKHDSSAEPAQSNIGNGSKGRGAITTRGRGGKTGGRPQKEMIQIKATFENFKVEPKSTKQNVTGTSSRVGGSSGKTTIKREKIENNEEVENMDTGNGISDKYIKYESDAEEDEPMDSDLELDSSEQPICWSNKKNSQLPIKKEESTPTVEDVEKQLQTGRLLLLPMIFGSTSGDTDYKLQVMRSGKMRLVNKRTGFVIDLVNTGNLDTNSKEVVEVEGDKIIRYGTIRDQDIYAPIRNANTIM